MLLPPSYLHYPWVFESIIPLWSIYPTIPRLAVHTYPSLNCQSINDCRDFRIIDCDNQRGNQAGSAWVKQPRVARV